MFFSVPGVKKIYYSNFFRIFSGCFFMIFPDFFRIFPGCFLRFFLDFFYEKMGWNPGSKSETTIPGSKSETTIPGRNLNRSRLARPHINPSHRA